MLPPKLIAGAPVSSMAVVTEASRSYSVQGRLSSGHNLDFGVPDAGSRSTTRQAPDGYPQNLSARDVGSQESDWFRHRRSDETGLGQRGQSDSSLLEVNNTDGRLFNRNQYPLANSTNDGGQLPNLSGTLGLPTVDSGNIRIASSAEGGMPKSTSLGWTPSHGTFSLRSGNTAASSAEGNSLVRDRDAGAMDFRRTNDRIYSAQVKRHFCLYLIRLFWLIQVSIIGF